MGPMVKVMGTWITKTHKGLAKAYILKKLKIYLKLVSKRESRV